VRIVFFGATALGYACAERLIQLGADVVGLVTMPRDFRISYSPSGPVRNVQHRDFHVLGERHAVPVVQVTQRMSEHLADIEALRPDLLVVVGWYYMIPRRMRDLAPLGCVGVHASLLPRYRGGAPLVWAMINGERETGVSLFHFTDGVDDGDIVAQTRFPIDARDTIAELLAKAEAASVTLLAEFVPRFADGSAPRQAQDHSAATAFPQRSPIDGRIDWNWDAPRIDRFIRAQTHPYPGAFTDVAGKRLRVWSADVELAPEDPA
jgi:methionyl-tRNA formyltransferase